MMHENDVITVSQYIIANPGRRLREICTGTSLPRSTVRDILDLMVERGCVDAKIISVRNPTRYFPVKMTYKVADTGVIP